MSTLANAIKALAPGAGFTFKDDDLSTLEWLNDSIDRPSDSAINAKKAELDAELPMQMLRLERNRLLFESDWMAGQDRTMTQAEKDYRQALRDTPAQDGVTGLNDVTWPTKPE
jgi:hypothetical protein